MDPIEMLYDENNTDPIVLYDEDGEAISFDQVALICLGNQDFAILAPCEPMEGMAEDEALVFSITQVGEEEVLEVVTDDEVVDQVFEEYYRLLAEEEAN